MTRCRAAVGAWSIALALSAADPALADEDVDFRQGDRAYEGDFKIIRARLPQLVAFAVISVFLLGLWQALDFLGQQPEAGLRKATQQTL